MFGKRGAPSFRILLSPYTEGYCNKNRFAANSYDCLSRCLCRHTWCHPRTVLERCKIVKLKLTRMPKHYVPHADPGCVCVLHVGKMANRVTLKVVLMFFWFSFSASNQEQISVHWRQIRAQHVSERSASNARHLRVHNRMLHCRSRVRVCVCVCCTSKNWHLESS